MKFIEMPSKRINITLDPKVMQRLDALAEEAGVSRSGMIAILVNKNHFKNRDKM